MNNPARAYGARISKTPAEPKTYDVWCYFCEWHEPDSMAGRKRFGQHVVDRHPEEVRFKKGEKPPEVVEV